MDGYKYHIHVHFIYKGPEDIILINRYSTWTFNIDKT